MKQISSYLRLYPNLSLEEIQGEMRKFDEILKSTPISPDSSNYMKYVRGWLMRANFEKGEPRDTKRS